MSILHLNDRALVKISGKDAEALLQRLITTDLDDVATGEAGYGALLTPQGKILMDFLVVRQEDGFLFDLDINISEAFIKKMTLYRMRSDVVIERLDLQVGVSLEEVSGAVSDPRSDLLGWRLYGSADEWTANETEMARYHQAHIEAAVPRSGLDFELGDAFPYDINMDFLGGLDFEKGCYVGQEVVSRMHHRGTARRRIVVVSADEALPNMGTEITAEGKTIGTLGAVAGTKGLALVRIDRSNEAKEESQAIKSGEVVITVSSPIYADFEV